MTNRKISRETRKATGIHKSRPRKRKLIFNPKTVESKKESFTTPAKKLKGNDDLLVSQDNSVEYRILNFIAVFSAISNLVKCKVCNGNVKFETASTRGLGFKIVVLCDKCDSHQIPSSPYIMHSYEINRRFIFTMRALGIGLAGVQKFCGLMDMPNFFYESTYTSILENIFESVKIAIDVIFKKAVKEEIENTPEVNNETEIPKLSVSGNKSCKKLGFTSLFGVSSVSGYYSGKVLDIGLKSAYCKLCEEWKNKLDTAEFKDWFKSHKDECTANEEVSAGKMEVDTTVEIFKRSVENYKIRYCNYIGDSDSESFTGIVNSNPYSDLQITKKECIQNLQKRMGTQLRELVEKSKNLDSEGKLTGKMIDKLAEQYGLAIRRNCHSVIDMKEAIWATYYHYSSTDKKPQHQNCSTGTDSWCSYQRAKANKESFTHDYKPLPKDVLEAMKPIYTELSKDSLLEGCVGGFTQNNHQSLNEVIWKISPKVMSSGEVPVYLSVYIAAGLFNEGSHSLLFFLKSIGVNCGHHAHSYAEKTDAVRISQSERHLESAISAEELLYGMDDSI